MIQALLTFRKLIQLEETLFGLPLALVGALLPFSTTPFHFDGVLFLWILLAFSAARSAGMSFNRLIDAELDRKNPRTQNRPLQRGEITAAQVKKTAWASSLLFLYACSKINLTCLLLSPLIVFLLFAYSYTKRFTALCHFILGLIEFFAPVMGWLAVDAPLSFAPLLLGLGMMLWISGMDILYAIQDIDFDRSMRLHSIPAALGAKKSRMLAKLLHILSLFLFCFAGFFAGAHLLFYVGLLIASALFLYQHQIFPKNPRRAFLLCNSLIALTLFAFTLGSIL